MPPARWPGARSRKISSRERASFSLSQAMARLSARRSLAAVSSSTSSPATMPPRQRRSQSLRAPAERAADQRFHQGRGFRLSAQQSLEPVIGMHELDLGKRNPGGFERLDRGIEGAGMPGYRDRHVA